MYAAFFGLAQEPFSIAPDPRFLFMSDAHREALAHLLYGLGGEGGFVLLTGEIGAGKTTVCRCFLEQVPADCDVAYIVNPKLTAIELLQTVCDEFGIVTDEPMPGAALTVKSLLDPLYRHVLERHAQGRHCVLVIDEAQSLSADVLEQLRLLTNLETTERKLLQIVLIGQPELRQMLARPELEQLAQRVVARFHLGALDESATSQYVHHRLTVAGLRGPSPFEPAALRRLYRLTGGVPRRINLLAGRAMLGAYAAGVHRIGVRVVEKAAAEVFDDATPRRSRRVPAWVLAGATGLAAGGVVAFVWLSAEPRRAHAPTPAAASGPLTSSSPSAVAGTAASSAASAASAAWVTVASSGAPAAAASSPGRSAAGEAVAFDGEAQAWRVLAARWRAELPAGADPCTALEATRLRCFRSRGGLDEIRRLDRPAILVLEAGSARRGYVVLTAVGDDRVVVQTPAGPRTVSLPALAQTWRGDFSLLWRAPDGWREGVSTTQSLEDWLDPRLRQVLGAAPGGSDLRDRVRAFQVAQGLRPDGQAGPLTLMSLARATGDEGPRLEGLR
jgi:general secretion pathway protein A